MAKDESVKLVTLPADADLSAKQYLVGKLANSSGVARVAVCGDGENGIGSIYEGAATAGDPSAIAVSGIVKLTAGATMATAGIAVACGANGKINAVGTGDYVLGYLLNSAVDGDVVDVLWAPQGTA